MTDECPWCGKELTLCYMGKLKALITEVGYQIDEWADYTLYQTGCCKKLVAKKPKKR